MTTMKNGGTAPRIKEKALDIGITALAMRAVILYD